MPYNPNIWLDQSDQEKKHVVEQTGLPEEAAQYLQGGNLAELYHDAFRLKREVYPLMFADELANPPESLDGLEGDELLKQAPAYLYGLREKRDRGEHSDPLNALTAVEVRQLSEDLSTDLQRRPIGAKPDMSLYDEGEIKKRIERMRRE